MFLSIVEFAMNSGENTWEKPIVQSKKSNCRMQRYGIQKMPDCYFILSLHNPNASGVMDLWESYYHILMCSDKDILMCSDKVNKKVVTPLNSGKPSRNCVDSIHYP